MQVEIQSIHFNADQKLISFIESKLDKLKNYFNQIVRCEVILKLEAHSQVKDKIAEVKIHLPGDLLFVKEVDKTFENSIDRAISIVVRQLKKYKDRLRNH